MIARGSFNAMRQLLQGTGSGECELCNSPLPPRHDHLIEPAARQISCVCGACAVLFSSGGKTIFRRIGRSVRRLDSLRLTDAQWERFGIPVSLAFVFNSSLENTAQAFYPSPAGPVESPLDPDAWDEVVSANPSLGEMLPDIEALLINRLSTPHSYFLSPIDECYRLAGLIRKHWQGLSGGGKVRHEIEAFFAGLAERAGTATKKTRT
ncbi:MAG: hypothetical protein GXX84_01980 [Acidobacteria bacterium]|nr:hypothetical protein [Acidobacteriota bacterium]